MVSFFKDKKVAVGLFGIYHQENLNHWMGWITQVNYKSTLENNKTFVYNKLNNPTFFSSTYFSSVLVDLIRDFNFNSIKLTQVINKKQDNLDEAFFIRNTRFLETIELILNSGETFDYVLLTRYDLWYTTSPIDSLDTNKINIVCETKWGTDESLIDDNFYFLPGSKLKYFYDTLKASNIRISSHRYNKLFKKWEFHYLLEGKFYSHEIPLYQVKRN